MCWKDQYIREEGRAYAAPTQLATLPLYLYWNDRLADNYTVAKASSIRDAELRGYQRIRVEGHIFPTEQSGTVPLRVFYSPERGDFFTTATKVGVQSALDSGYQDVGIEGYVFEK